MKRQAIDWEEIWQNTYMIKEPEPRIYKELLKLSNTEFKKGKRYENTSLSRYTDGI